MSKPKPPKAAAHAAGTEADGTAGAAGPKGGRKRMIMIAVPVLLAGLGAGAWFSGVLPRMLGLAHPPAPTAAQVAAAQAPVFVDMPEIVANLNSAGRRPSYIKLSVRLQVPDNDDAEKVKAAMPKLQDLLQTYLREMRPEELHGSEGTYRLREELIARANIAVSPAHVTDVLFPEMLVQ